MQFSIVLAVIFCSLAVLAEIPFPQTPDQFQANIKISQSGIFPTPPVSGTYYYDYPNMRERIDQADYGNSITTTLHLWDSMTGYYYNNLAKQCKCLQLNGTMNPANVPYGSIYEGNDTIGATEVYVWGLDTPFMNQSGITIDFYVTEDADPLVLRINTTIANPMMGAITTLMDISQYKVGAPAASLFQPPSYCACPAPPPPPGPGSCPNSPGPVCQCAATTDLAFCTQVNYPVAQALDVAFTDSFVKAAYNTMMATLPNPSQTCQENFQAFLCAMYFPECVGEDIPILYLPCPDLCPFCGCGDLIPNGNCTAAPVNMPCTAYGPAFCKSQ